MGPARTAFFKIEVDFGIAPDAAVKLLRPKLESGEIHTDLVGWDPTGMRINNGAIRFPQSHADWARTGGELVAHCVAEDGWKHVNWEGGSLRGCVIRVLWRDVERQLAPLAAMCRFPSSEGCTSEAENSLQSIGLLALLPEHLRTDTKAGAAFSALYTYAQEQVKDGRLPKRDLAASVVARRAGYPVRRVRELYLYLPENSRNPSRKLRA